MAAYAAFFLKNLQIFYFSLKKITTFVDYY